MYYFISYTRYFISCTHDSTKNSLSIAYLSLDVLDALNLSLSIITLT